MPNGQMTCGRPAVSGRSGGPAPAVVHDGLDPREQPAVRRLADDQEPAGRQQAAQDRARRGHHGAGPGAVHRGDQGRGQALGIGPGHAAEAQVDDGLVTVDKRLEAARRRPGRRAGQQPVAGDGGALRPVGGPGHDVRAEAVQHRDGLAAGRPQRVVAARPRRQRELVPPPAVDGRPAPRAGQPPGGPVGTAVQRGRQADRPGGGRELAGRDQRGLGRGDHGRHAEELGQVLAQRQHRVMDHHVGAQPGGRGGAGQQGRRAAADGAAEGQQVRQPVPAGQRLPQPCQVQVERHERQVVGGGQRAEQGRPGQHGLVPVGSQAGGEGHERLHVTLGSHRQQQCFHTPPRRTLPA